MEQQLTFLSNNMAQQLSQLLKNSLENEQQQQIKVIVDQAFSLAIFQSIVILDNTEQVIYQFNNKVSEQPACAWVFTLFTLSLDKQVVNVEGGLGRSIELTLDTQHASLLLWHYCKEIVYWTLALFIIIFAFACVWIKKIYAPIKTISQQAKLIQHRNYVEIKKLPRARELNEFVSSMNLMVKHIQNTFIELTLSAEITRKEAYIDQQTEIPNRRAFDDKLDSYLSKSSGYQGFIGVIKINDLAQFNKRQGRMAGDDLILQIINEVSQTMVDEDSFYLCRLSGSKLSFFVENQSVHSIESICHRLASKFNKIESYLYKETAKNIIALGVVEFTRESERDNILSILNDLTLHAADLSVGYSLQYLTVAKNNVMQIFNNPKQILEDILSTPKSSIKLKIQKVKFITDRPCFDYEIFSSFVYDNNELSATDVFAMAGRYELTCAIDEAIIKNMLFYIEQLSLAGEVFSIRLAHLTFINEKAVLKIVSLIKKSQKGSRFVIQVHECSIVNNIHYAKNILKHFEQAGCAICINNFGASIESLQYLIEIQPDFVKIAPTFTQHIDKKPNNMQMVSAFVRMVHGLNIPVIAHCVETNEELIALIGLRFDAALGYIIGMPEMADLTK